MANGEIPRIGFERYRKCVILISPLLLLPPKYLPPKPLLSLYLLLHHDDSTISWASKNISMNKVVMVIASIVMAKKPPVQFGQLPRIVVETRDELAETPEEYRLRLKEERLAHAKHQFAEDPFVSELKERFDATVREESIEPRDGGTHV